MVAISIRSLSLPLPIRILSAVVVENKIKTKDVSHLGPSITSLIIRTEWREIVVRMTQLKVRVLLGPWACTSR